MSTSSIQFALPLRIPVRLLPREDFFRSPIKRRLSADGSILSETTSICSRGWRVSVTADGTFGTALCTIADTA